MQPIITDFLDLNPDLIMRDGDYKELFQKILADEKAKKQFFSFIRSELRQLARPSKPRKLSEGATGPIAKETKIKSSSVL